MLQEIICLQIIVLLNTTTNTRKKFGKQVYKNPQTTPEKKKENKIHKQHHN